MVCVANIGKYLISLAGVSGLDMHGPEGAGPLFPA